MLSPSGSNMIKCQGKNLKVALSKGFGVDRIIDVESTKFEIAENVLHTTDGEKKSFIVSLAMQMFDDKGSLISAERKYTFKSAGIDGCTF